MRARDFAVNLKRCRLTLCAGGAVNVNQGLSTQIACFCPWAPYTVAFSLLCVEPISPMRSLNTRYCLVGEFADCATVKNAW